MSVPIRTRQRTLCLEPEADEYLESVVPQRTGKGAFVSYLILERKLRRELEAQQARPVSTKQSWESSGINVD
jgi:hypothetical protein